MTDYRKPEEDDRRRRYATAGHPLPLLMAIHGSRHRLEETPIATLREWDRILRIALKREHAKGKAGHWSYDLNRHIGIKTALEKLSARFAAPGKPVA